MSHLQFIDELVREYLLFRGFSASLKAFDIDLKNDKDKGFRVDKIIDQILQYIYTYDLTGLRDMWNHLDTRLFTRLESHFAPAVRKIEYSILKFYLVNASENNKVDKITEFFSKMSPELVGQSEWKDWFVLPFIKNPEENPIFSVFFTKQWQDTLLVSIHNFLAMIYQAMPLPTLASFEENAAKMTSLQKENEILKKGLASLMTEDVGKPIDLTQGLEMPLDDFHNISQEMKATEAHSKMLKTMMKSIHLPSGSSPKQTLPVKPIALTTQSHIARKPTSRAAEKGGREGRDKRSLSIGEGRERGTGRRDASLDVMTSRREREGSFLFLSQEEYSEHSSAITSAKLNTRGTAIASCDATGSLRTWSLTPRLDTWSHVQGVQDTCLTCLDWVPSHERYVVVGGGACLKLVDVREGKGVWSVEVSNQLPLTRVDDLACSPDSNIIVVSDGKLLVFDLKTRRLERTLQTKDSTATCCAVNHNGQLVLTGCADGTAQLLDLRRNEVLEVLPRWASEEDHGAGAASGGEVLQVSFTQDFTGYYAVNADSKLCLRSLTQRDKQQVVTLPFDHPSPHGKLAALDASETFLLTLAASTGVIYKLSDSGVSKSLELGGHKSPLTCVDWSFANQCASCLTASQDGRIRVSTLLVDHIHSTY